MWLGELPPRAVRGNCGHARGRPDTPAARRAGAARRQPRGRQRHRPAGGPRGPAHAVDGRQPAARRAAGQRAVAELALPLPRAIDAAGERLGTGAAAFVRRRRLPHGAAGRRLRRLGRRIGAAVAARRVGSRAPGRVAATVGHAVGADRRRRRAGARLRVAMAAPRSRLAGPGLAPAPPAGLRAAVGLARPRRLRRAVDARRVRRPRPDARAVRDAADRMGPRRSRASQRRRLRRLRGPHRSRARTRPGARVALAPAGTNRLRPRHPGPRRWRAGRALRRRMR